MRPHTKGCLLRQKSTRQLSWGVCLCHALSTSLISFIALYKHKAFFFQLLTLTPIRSQRLPSFCSLCLQVHKPSRHLGSSQETSLWGWEPQLCWSVRCCGPLGPCSGWKMASSWDRREAFQAFRATAWLEKEVNSNNYKIWSTACQGLMGLFEINNHVQSKYHRMTTELITSVSFWSHWALLLCLKNIKSDTNVQQWKMLS